MYTSRHSGNDLFSSDEQTEDDSLWPAPVATAPVHAVLQIPGSKSLTNRELILSAIADGPSELRHPLHSRDTQLMIEGLRDLGVTVEEVAGDGRFGPDLHIEPGELLGGTTIDCGLAGTVMRFLPPVAALARGTINFEADAQAYRRPMNVTIDALRALGVDIDDDGRGSLPFTIHGTGGVVGGPLSIDATVSSQFVSGLLLAAPRFEQGLDLSHIGERLPSLPHIDMTITALGDRGATVAQIGDDRWVVNPGPIAGHTVLIEPDLSNAAPFLAAAAITSGSVTIADWPEQTTQVGDMFPNILELMGAQVDVADGALSVTGTGRVRGVDIDLSACGELAPTVAGLAALADSPSTLRGIGHLRGHETDRLAALATELNALGGDVIETDDGLIITPQPLTGGVWHSYADHRMATTGALIGLVTAGIRVEHIETTAKTLPEFVELWELMLGITTAGTVTIEVEY